MFRSRKEFLIPVCLASVLALAAHPVGAAVDLSQKVDANTLGLLVSNLGWAGYDPMTANPGLEYPRGSGKFVLFAGGIWLGAKVQGTTRVALAEYASEFTPGPMAAGTFQSDRPDFRVFKLFGADTTGSGDWMATAVPQGAPTTAFGTRPAVLGSRTTWSVCNDANPAAHTLIGGHTASLGVEVRQTAWASADNALEDHVVFVKWQVRNAGAALLDSMFIGLWADPDLGAGSDDLIGTDPALEMAYVYNATNNDFVYGANPPALAYALLQGPSLAPHPYALNTYIGGDDAQNAEESYRFLLGLKRNGAAWVDPGNSQPTRSAYTGDPVTGTGWLQSNPTDQRFLISCGPFPLAPGDSQEVVMAIVVAQGANRLQSITLLRSYVTSLRALVDVPPPPPAVAARVSLAPLVSPTMGMVRAQLTAPLGEAWRLDVFDVRGRRAALVARGIGTGEAESATWDAAGAAPGVYWMVASSGTARASRRVVLVSR